MLCFPNAKINLGLNIVSRRADGFHNLESVFYAIGLCDALEVIENKKKSGQKIHFTSSGISIPGNPGENLCVKAYHLLDEQYSLPPVEIHLHKHIPIGAGLGGGSADAAFLIRLLNEKFDLGLAWGELHHFAKQLGSDCSFFVSNKPSFVQGKGDEFESISLDLSSYYCVLIYPGIHINTAAAYRGVVPKPARRSLENDLLSLPVEEWKEAIHNDFEDSIFPQHPEIAAIKEKMYALGASYAAMSGSGSTVFGLFKSEAKLQHEFPGLLYWEGKM